MSPPIHTEHSQGGWEVEVKTRLEHLESKMDRVLTILEGDANNLNASLLARINALENVVKILMWVSGVMSSAVIGSVVVVAVKFVFSGGMASGVK